MPEIASRKHMEKINQVIAQALKDAGLYEKASLVQNCCLPDEKACPSLDEADEDPSYFTTILVKA